MNEITRIHIAKVPYDIEIAAKKELEKYIQALSVYADDEELLQDIEIRITELLAERKVFANGVVASDDVTAIRTQLGEPKEFMGDDNNGNRAVDRDVEISGDSTRKLFRNVDSAVLGGVLSGVASFFKMNPMWVRIVFLVLLFASFGTVLLLYAVLWIAIPPARTAAEKLQMNGRPVTLASIRELNEDEPNLVASNDRANTIRRVLLVVLGSGALLVAVCVLALTAFAAFSFVQYDMLDGIAPDAEWFYITAYVLAIVAGVLLATLCTVAAYAAFARKLTKRLIVSVVVIIVMGLSTFGAAVGLVSYQSWQSNDQMMRNISEKTVALPGNFASATSLTINAPSTRVEYIVDSKPRMIVKSLPGMGQPVVSIDNTKATISFDPLVKDTTWAAMQPTLTIYGPKLDNLVVKQGFVAYDGKIQDLSVETAGVSSSVNLQQGTFGKLTVKASDQSSVDASDVTVLTADIDAKTSATVSLGTVKSLSVVQTEACPAGGSSTRVDVHGIHTNTMQYNGVVMSAKTHETNCGTVRVGVLYSTDGTDDGYIR